MRQAWVDVSQFNEVMNELDQELPERQVDFKDTPILKDKADNDVCYTFVPCDKDHKCITHEIEKEHNQDQIETDVNSNKVDDELQSSDSDNMAKMQDKIKSKLISKMADMYQTANNAGAKFDPEKYHWEVLKNWRDENVKYTCLRNIERYKFKSEDEEGFFQDQVVACQKFFNKKISDGKKGEAEMQVQSHYEVNQLTGEKFLRLLIREWKTSYDPEISQKRDKRRSNVSAAETKQDGQEFEIQSLKFFKFDEEL